MKLFLITFAVLIIAVVVVCPVTPTPVAVVGVQGPATHAAPAAFSPVAALMAPKAAQIPLWIAPAIAVAAPVSHDVVSLTCARLC